jgi:hypothetical protein
LEVPDGTISEAPRFALGATGLRGHARDMVKDLVQTREGLKAIGEDRRTGSKSG